MIKLIIIIIISGIQKISNLIKIKNSIDFGGYKNKFELIMRLFVIPGNLDLFLHKWTNYAIFCENIEKQGDPGVITPLCFIEFHLLFSFCFSLIYLSIIIWLQLFIRPEPDVYLFYRPSRSFHAPKNHVESHGLSRCLIFNYWSNTLGAFSTIKIGNMLKLIRLLILWLLLFSQKASILGCPKSVYFHFCFRYFHDTHLLWVHAKSFR